MSFFKFKQFEILQNKTAMKVNTDGVLLGAFILIDNSKTIIDVGTGTGVISLMMAQKFANADILAVEIDKDAAQEAKYNVENSPWSNKIKVINDDFLTFASNNSDKFDLIVSNPPFFENQLVSEDSKKILAKHTLSMPFAELVKSVFKLLSENGKFYVILPFNMHQNFVSLCKKNKFFITSILNIFPTENKAANRIIMSFSKQEVSFIEQNLFIRKNGKYSEEYLKLTADFYLFA
ncbi:MAG: methyltransferase [Bacteroidales bacterium]|nr:methyltransferase [Bacteroidales bacterium]